MDLNAITSLITTLGFPIVACIYMAYLVKDMNDKHSSEMNSIKEALNANTSAIDKLETLINQLLMRINGKSE